MALVPRSPTKRCATRRAPSHVRRPRLLADGAAHLRAARVPNHLLHPALRAGRVARPGVARLGPIVIVSLRGWVSRSRERRAAAEPRNGAHEFPRPFGPRTVVFPRLPRADEILGAGRKALTSTCALVADPVARAGSEAGGAVVGIGELAAVEREAAAADAFRQPELQALQFGDPVVDP